MNLSNIERAHMNKPKLMMGGSYQSSFNRTNPYGTQGFNQFQPGQTYQSMQNFYPPQNQFNSQQIPQMMMTQPLQYQMGEGNNFQGIDIQQEQQAYQQQIYQTPQNDYNNKQLKLNQQPALEKVHNIELLNYGGQLPKEKIQSPQENPNQDDKLYNNQKQLERPPTYNKYQPPTSNQKNDFMKQQNKQEDDSNCFLELYDIEENDPIFKNSFPECVISPQQLALEEQFKLEEDTTNKQDREAALRAEDAYRKIGRKQYEFNELMFNKDAVERQKKKTQDLIAKGLQSEMEKLEKGAEEFENQIKEADEYLKKIENETNEFDQKLDQLKFVRQAERALKKIERSEKNNLANLEQQDDIRIEKDMNIAEINEKLEETYKKNAELFLEINKLILENKEEEVQLEQDELFYFENYVDKTPELANSEIKTQKPKINNKNTAKKKSKMKK